MCDLFYLSCIRVKILISDFVFRRGLLAGFGFAGLFVNNNLSRAHSAKIPVDSPCRKSYFN